MDNLHNWKKRFIIIWTGQALSLFSSAIVQLAIIWHLTETTKSAMVLAIAAVAGFLPQGILGPFAGALIDRSDRKKIMIFSDLGIAAATMILVITGYFIEIPLWLFMVILAVRSVGSAFHTPTLQAVTPSIVPADMITKCSGYSQTFLSVSYIFSPVAAALLYSLISLNYIIFLDVAGALIGVLSIMLVSIPRLKLSEERKEQPVIKNLVKDTKEGLLEIKRHGFTSFTLLLVLFTLVVFPMGTLFPLMVFAYFEKTAFHAGVVESVWSVGMLAGSFILGLWGGTKNRVHMISLAMAIVGITTFFSGMLPKSGYIYFAALTAVMGLGVPFYNSHIAIFQSRIPEEFLGRVMAILNSLTVLVMPVGLALAGLFADKTGIANWFIMSGALMLLLAFITSALPSSRNADAG